MFKTSTSFILKKKKLKHIYFLKLKKRNLLQKFGINLKLFSPFNPQQLDSSQIDILAHTIFWYI